jgi:predicted nucleic acid-binding protein
LGAAEVAWALVRSRNLGTLASATFSQAIANLTSEVVASSQFGTLPVENTLIEKAMPLIDTHSLNATDALVLRWAIDLAVRLRPAGDDLVLVASDHRLLRAANAEGLPTFDPEIQTEADLDLLIVS